MVNERKAKAVVTNLTGQRLYSVTLLHKYSNVDGEGYREASATSVVNPSSSSTPMEVKYHTGFGTTGRDWWVVFWWDEDYKHLYCSTPNNYRNVIDWVDKHVPKVVDRALTILQTYIVRKFGVYAGAATAFGVEMVEDVVNDVFNGEETDGWKQHMLTDQDNEQRVEINILPNNKFEISSPSGKSPDVWSAREPSAPAQAKLQEFIHEAEAIADDEDDDDEHEGSGDDHKMPDDDVYDNEEDRIAAKERAKKTGFIVMKPKHLPPPRH